MRDWIRQGYRLLALDERDGRERADFGATKFDGSHGSIADVGPAFPLLRGVLALYEAMGRKCIAEHVETDAHLRIFRQPGCRYGKGFGFARPMIAAAAAEHASPSVISLASFRPEAQHVGN